MNLTILLHLPFGMLGMYLLVLRLGKRMNIGPGGLTAGALMAAAERDETAEAYAALSREAIARGVFGSPSYVYRDEVLWGQDRLDFLDRALAAD